VSFLSQHLRPTQGWNIAEEYPLAIDNTNANNVRVIKDREQFLSAAVMRPLVVKSPAGLFKVAAIGSVVTHPGFRNQGLSRQILDDCLTAARDHGCDFAILWTDLFDFYRKLGFELAGSETAVELPVNMPADGSEGLRFLESAKVDPEAILRLYAQHTTGTIRTAEDIRKFLRIPNARVFTAWDSESRLQAYAVEGKGADLNGYIHEWGGGVSKLLPLLRYAQTQTHNGQLHLIAPDHAQNLIRHLMALGAKANPGVLGMIKLLNAPGFMVKLKKYMRGLGMTDMVFEAREGHFYMGHGQQIFRTDSEVDVIKLAFGPVKASQLGGLDAATAAKFEEVFPIPMWVWGWDSV